MGQENALLYAFNRGILSKLGLARTDLKVQALSAEIQTNWMPRELGSMMLRAGWGYIDGIYNNQKAVHAPFIKALSDTAIIEFTNQMMRVRVNEAIIARPSVSTTVTNGTFSGDITGWTDGDEAGATSQWISGNFMSLQGNGSGSRAIRSQVVTVASGDRGTLHALRIVTTKGYVTLRVGTTLGDDSYINNIELSPGTYSLAFTPTGNFTIEVTANTAYTALIKSINIEASGNMTLPAPWLLADLPYVRWDQSEDVVFLACAGYAQYKIERIGNAYSWGICFYLVDDGPFQLINTDQSILMAPSALTGDTTLISSIPYFKTGHIGALFRITSQSQNTNDVIGGPNQATNFIEVSDVGGNRQFAFQISGSWSGTVHLERSAGTPGTWISVATYTSNQNTTFNDGFDNQIMYYRFNFESTYTSGAATIAMQYSGGGITGIARVTGFNSSRSVNIEVLKEFGSAGGASSYASGNIDFGSSNPTNGDTITLNGVVWTFVTSGASGAQTNIKGSLVLTLTQLATDVSASANGLLTVASYVSTSTKFDIFYNTPGTAGNAYTLAASAATPSGATLTGGSASTSINEVSTWSEGEWSPLNGYPSAVALYEGRLWWFGFDSADGSVSDAFSSFDDTVTGDSGPISRSIGSGPVQTMCWGLALLRLVLGGEMKEFSISSSYLNEALTPTDNNIKSPSSRGSARVAALQIDTNGIFAQRGDPDTNANAYGTRLIQLSFQGNYAPVDYTADDLTKLCPELVAVGIVKIAVQRKPDTRIHCILADGTVAVLVYDPIENIKCFILCESTGASGIVEDVIIMPGGTEDKVYYSVNRTIEGATVRYLEKWALETDCIGGVLNKNLDCFIVITNGSPSTAISAPQLAGQTVAFWADGVDVGTDVNGEYIITLDASGNGTSPVAYTNGVVGLPYIAQFKSAKLAYAAANGGTALTKSKSIDKLGIIAANMHAQGLKYGPSFDDLQNLPGTEDGAVVPPNKIWGEYDKESFEFDGDWSVDSRLCLQAQSPRPCNILAAVISMTTSETI